ncbi:MAG: helix-turn-helix transcriptional regulator [Rhodospirillaceae bacterium]|nr:helix-turn-helix transcriptional regulator [Rhodospirillaceae bacterium]
MNLLDKLTADQLRQKVVDLQDLLEIAQSRGEPTFPTCVLDRILAGENPVRVYREHRELTQRSLAKTAGISTAYLSEIETGAKGGSATALKSIALALDVPMENLVN